MSFGGTHLKNKWLHKCKTIKNGLKKSHPNTNISDSFLQAAYNTLDDINTLLQKESYQWITVMNYYCAYYMAMSILHRNGVTSKNHSCTITFIQYLGLTQLSKHLQTLKKHRIESQYLIKLQNKKSILKDFRANKKFYQDLHNKVKNDEIIQKEKVKTFFKNK